MAKQKQRPEKPRRRPKGAARRSRFWRVRVRLRRIRAGLGRINRFLGGIKPPLPDTQEDGTPTKSPRSAVMSATLCLGLAALMVSGKIVEIADRLPLGPDRDRWLAAADETDRVGNLLSLNQPYDALRDRRGAGDDVGQQVDVIGDLEDLMSLDPGEVADRFGEAVLAQSPNGGAASGTPEEPLVSATSSAEVGIVSPESQTQPGDIPDGQADGAGEPGQPGETNQPGGTGESMGEESAGEAGAPDGTEQPGQPDEEQEPRSRRSGPVSVEAPLQTFAVGDSQAFYLGHGLRTSRMSDVLELTLDQRHSTGLARPGYFNWPVHLYAIAAYQDPELVVMTLGSNDWQNMTTPEGQILNRGSTEWIAEWGRRLSVAFDVLDVAHRQVIWVGLPPTRGDEFREGYALMNRIATDVAAERDFVTMIDIWEMFGGDDPYRETIPPPWDPDGTPVDVRQQDGIHLNQAGGRWVVEIVADEIDRIIADINSAEDPAAG